MDKRRHFSIEALFGFLAGIIFFIYGLFYIGVFSRYTYFAKVEATTGPDFWVVLGKFKLKFQMPDTISHQDCGGIMVNTNNLREIFKTTREDHSLFEWDYYYVITGKVVGVKRSDGDAFHPFIEVSSSYKIDKFLFWILTVVDIAILIFFGLYYKRTQRKDIRNGTL